MLSFSKLPPILNTLFLVFCVNIYPVCPCSEIIGSPRIQPEWISEVEIELSFWITKLLKCQTYINAINFIPMLK